MDENEKKKPSSKDDILEDALEFYDRASVAQRKNVENWLDDMRFARLGEQWPDAVKAQREKEGRPCLTINKLPAFIRQVTNDARQNSPSIKFHPVGDGASKEVAEILDGLTRNIEYSSNADVAYDTALDHAVTAGFGYFRVVTDYASDDVFDQDIKIECIQNPLSVIADPYCMESDSAQWNDCMITDMWTHDDFKARWPKAECVDFEAQSHDRATWFTDDEVRVSEYWTRRDESATLLQLSDGSCMFEPEYEKIRDICEIQGITIKDTRQTTTKRVMQYIISGAEVLETNKWPGKYIPIVPVYGDEVVIDGERHFISLIRFSKDSQRMFNYWRTASTELVALAPKTPFIGARGSFNTDAQKWATANTVSHAYIEYDPVSGGSPPQRQQFAGPPAGALQESLNAADDMKSIMGIYDASLGARSNETSGRAIMARQREGDVSTFNFIDNLSRSIRHTGRIICDLIPKVYNVPRIIRVIKDNGESENTPINQQFNAPPDPKKQQHDQEEMHEQMGGIVKMYDLTCGKYDVTCETGPSFTTRREEAANQMLEFIRAMPAAAPLIGDKLARNMDWPEADDIADRLKAMLPPQLQDQNPQIQQLQQQMQQMDGQAKQVIGDLNQQLKQLQESQAIEAEKLRIDRFNAETNRMKIAPVQQVQNVTQNEMSESEKLQFDAEVKLALEDKKHQGAMELEMLKQRASLAQANTNDLITHDESFNAQPNITAIDSITQLANHLESMNRRMSAPRLLIRDENGRPIGSRIAEDGE